MSRCALITLLVCLATVVPRSFGEGPSSSSDFAAPSESMAHPNTTPTPAPTPVEPVFPADPTSVSESSEPRKGDWVVLRPDTVLRSSVGKNAASPFPKSYLVDRVESIGGNDWYWVIGDTRGWVIRDSIELPWNTFNRANELIHSSLDGGDGGQVEPSLYVMRALSEMGQPLRGKPADNGPFEPDQAIGDLTEALRLNPSDMLAHYFLAKAYEGRAIPRDEFALAELMEAIRLDPHFLPAYYDRARVYEILAIRMWRDECIDPAGLDEVPSGRVLAFYRRAYDDLNVVVRADPTFADAKGKLQSLANKVTTVEGLTRTPVQIAAGYAAAPQMAWGNAAFPPLNARFASAQSAWSPPHPSVADPSGQITVCQQPPSEWVNDALSGRPDMPKNLTVETTGQHAAWAARLPLGPPIGVQYQAPSKSAPPAFGAPAAPVQSPVEPQLDAAPMPPAPPAPATPVPNVDKPPAAPSPAQPAAEPAQPKGE